MKHLFVHRDSSIVTYPDGTWCDWSMYGPDCKDAIDYYNDARRYGNHCLGIGALAGVLFSGAVAGVCFIVKRNREKAKEIKEKADALSKETDRLERIYEEDMRNVGTVRDDVDVHDLLGYFRPPEETDEA